jgi:membrane protein YqaA with SNARE-associated domain
MVVDGWWLVVGGWMNVVEDAMCLVSGTSTLF